MDGGGGWWSVLVLANFSVVWADRLGGVGSRDLGDISWRVG